VADTPAITARALSMRGPDGPIYGPVDLEVPADGVTVLRHPPGEGRTALLLTLAGRMRPSGGELSVFGRTRATDIFGLAAVAGFDGVDDLVEAVTVADVLAEQKAWTSPWYRPVGRIGADDLAAVCEPVFGELPTPAPGTYVEELGELDRLLLRIALAATARPQLLVVGTVDAVTSDADRKLLAERLLALGERRTVLTSSANDAAALGLRTVAVPESKGGE